MRNRVLIAGGGVAALEAMIALHDIADDLFEVTLVAPQDDFVYRPLSVAEPFCLGHAVHHSLAELAADFDAELVRGTLANVDAAAHRAVLEDGSALAYDALLIAIGARMEPAFAHAITFGADGATEALSGLLADLEAGYVRRVAFVLPTSTGWSLPLYELALMTARDLMARGTHDVHLSLVTPEQRPLAIFGPQVSAAVSGLLEAAGVEFIGGSYADVRRGAIRLEPGGRTMEIDKAIALPVLRGPTIAGVPADRAGFIPTDPFGAVTGLPGVFAAGDATTFPVKQGGLAAQQADAVAQSVAAALGAPLAPRPFKPVLRGLLFTGDEDRFLRTSAGHALWWPPSKIAGLYLAPYLYRQTGWTEREPRRGFQEVEVPLEHVVERRISALDDPPLSGSGAAGAWLPR
jgi:sulfide:quinone oxidoreductase